MALSVEAINKSPSFVNPFGQQELNLKNKSITLIANTAATLNYFQCIDLSGNSIQSLSNFAYLDRMKTLIANDNRIKQIRGLSNLPSLQNLFLMNNRIDDFHDITNIKECKNLKRLVLINNPVTQRYNYRNFTVYTLESLTGLDFKKITKQQLKMACKHFSNK